MDVSEFSIPDPPPGVDIHLHAECENTQCAERGKPVHNDHIFGCNGLVAVLFTMTRNPHKPYLRPRWRLFLRRRLSIGRDRELRHTATLALAGVIGFADCATGTDKANELRSKCDRGQQSSCIDYQALVAHCQSAPCGLVPTVLRCQESVRKGH
jgi:hypothetical protein